MHALCGEWDFLFSFGTLPADARVCGYLMAYASHGSQSARTRHRTGALSSPVACVLHGVRGRCVGSFVFVAACFPTNITSSAGVKFVGPVSAASAMLRCFGVAMLYTPIRVSFAQVALRF